MRRVTYAVALLAVILLPELVSMAQTRPATREARLTVAVLDFDVSTAGGVDMGKQISEVLAAMLSGEESFTLVDRASLTRVLQELELNQTGLVSVEKAAKIGQLVGARILITGKAFVLDKQLYVTAKIIGTETSLVDGVLVKGDQAGEVGKLVLELSEKINARLRQAGPKLVASDMPVDPVPALVEKLKKVKLPKVAVSIPEQHHGPVPVRIDPAVETEVRMILQQAGFPLAEGDQKDLAKAGVELVISGEAFSEFAGRVGNLVSCSARIEVKIKPLAGEAVLYSDRETVRAIDLSENVAGKTALQKGGRLIAIRILEHFAKQVPAKP